MSRKLIFQTLYNEVIEAQPSSFRNEKELQDFCEKHLDALLGITFLSSEFPMNDARIDTLGIDGSNIPVIIEYKHKANADIIHQGLHYKSQLKNYKAEIMDLVKTKFKKGVDLKDVKFASARVICIAQEYSKFIKAEDYAKDRLRVELITYELFRGFIIFNLLSEPASREPSSQLLPVKTAPTKVNKAKTKRAPSSTQGTRDKRHIFKDSIVRDWYYFYSGQHKAKIRQNGSIFTVLKGSYLKIESSPSFIKGSPDLERFRKRKIANLRQEGNLCILDEDISFPVEGIGKKSSVSGVNQACNFILGLSVNIYTTLKDKNGLTMDKITRKSNSY